MVILGLSGYIFDRILVKPCHDSSVTLIVDNELRTSIQEERLTRVKHTGLYPFLSIDHILEYNNLKRDDIDVVSYTGLSLLPGIMPRKELNYAYKSMIQRKFPNSEIHLVDHHEAHAFSAIGTTPHRRGNFLTWDNMGDYYAVANGIIYGNNFSFGVFDKDTKIFHKYYNNICCDWFNLGDVYNALSHLTYGMYRESVDTNYEHDPSYFFQEENLEGKMMGAAAYGNHKNIQESELFQLIQHNKNDFPVLMCTSERKYLFKKLHNKHNYFDIAAYMQHIFSKYFMQTLEHIPKFMLEDVLCFSGGCALNINTNSQIADKKIWQDIYIPPAPTDAGHSLGSAMKVCFDKGIEVKIPYNVGCIGFHYPKEYIKNLLHNNKDLHNCRIWCEEDFNNIVNFVVESLVENRVVAWFQDKSEFGPRALGNRSILANPSIDNKDYLNNKVKFREFFRPYAGVILERFLHEVLHISVDKSPYMMFSGIVKESYRTKIPAITHYDNTCRIQTVTEQDNYKLNLLLEKFYEKTNIPCLLNTSFNTIPGEPIVETPHHAIASFLHSNVDILILENFIIIKN